MFSCSTILASRGPGGPLGPVLALLGGGILGLIAGFLDSLQAIYRAVLGPFWAVLGPSGTSLDRIEAILGRLEAISAAEEPPQVRSWKGLVAMRDPPLY